MAGFTRTTEAPAVINWRYMDSGDSDFDLLTAWRAGAAGAANQLCYRYSDKLRRFFELKVPANEVDELVQQTWLAVAQARDRIGSCKDSGVVNFRAYLFGIARHMVFGYYGKRGQLKGADFDPDVDNLATLEPSISRQLSVQRKVQWIELALQGLPMNLQMLFEAHYVEGLPGAELAVLFELPEGTIRSQLRRARTLLQKELDRVKLMLARPSR